MNLTDKQKSFLDKVVDGTWSINTDNGLVNVRGNVYMPNMNLTEIPVKFGKVSGNFNCGYNKLICLKGAPQSVGSSFVCYDSQLTSLEGAPQLVRDSFYCYGNRFTSLEGKPQSVGGYFHINLVFIDKKYYYVIIPQIEEMIEMGIKLYKPDKHYYPYKKAYYIDKLIELL
jgi:hypothetical protein